MLKDYGAFNSMKLIEFLECISFSKQQIKKASFEAFILLLNKSDLS